MMTFAFSCNTEACIHYDSTVLILPALLYLLTNVVVIVVDLICCCCYGRMMEGTKSKHCNHEVCSDRQDDRGWLRMPPVGSASIALFVY